MAGPDDADFELCLRQRPRPRQCHAEDQRAAGAQECAALNFWSIMDEHRNLFACITGLAALVCF